MPRQARNFAEGPYFHIVVQGVDREFIFGTPLLKSTYLKLLSVYQAAHDIGIITYCIMGNHAHLLVHAPSVDALSSFMHQVNTRYAGTYNKLNGRVGYVFRNRFLSQSVSDERYVMNCLVYIHNNPVKAGVVQNAADYTYSGLRCYLEGMGLVDFKRAAELFDTDPANVEAIMAEKSAAADAHCPVWLDTPEDRSDKEAAQRIMSSLIDDPTLLRHDKKRLSEAIRLMQDAGMSLCEIAAHLNISRPTLYAHLNRNK